jgi:hypothetical protein
LGDEGVGKSSGEGVKGQSAGSVGGKKEGEVGFPGMEWVTPGGQKCSQRDWMGGKAEVVSYTRVREKVVGVASQLADDGEGMRTWSIWRKRDSGVCGRGLKGVGEEGRKAKMRKGLRSVRSLAPIGSRSG